MYCRRRVEQVRHLQSPEMGGRIQIALELRLSANHSARNEQKHRSITKNSE